MTDKALLKMNDIGKSYYGTRVLKDINLEIFPGEIHAIIGENGAGKSTLMNILFGMNVIHTTGGHEGEIFIDGEKANITSPEKAMEYGIGMVHQEFMLLPEYTISENIKLNREILKPNFLSRFFGESIQSLDYPAMNKDARKALNRLEIDIEEYVTVAGLPVGYMQFAEIAREIDKKNVKVIIFDEPTAVLTEAEADNLMSTIKKIASEDIAIIFITHRLDEVKEICDNITIIRDGEHIATKATEDISVSEMAELMVGRKIEKLSRSSEDQTRNTVMEINDLQVNMPGERVKGVDLDIKEGEILGLGGLAGHGKIGIANGIMGLYPSKGSVKLRDEKVTLNDPRKAMAHQMAFVSEDRRGVGLLMDESIEMNIVINSVHNQDEFLHKFGPFQFKDSKSIRAHALKMIEDLDIRCTGPEQQVQNLSGGNQQKVCVARALTMNPDILFVSEPTRGIDVGAKRLVLDTLVSLNKELGMTIIMTSSELGELRSVCDRIALVTEGKIAGILRPDDSDAKFGLLMSGQTEEEGDLTDEKVLERL